MFNSKLYWKVRGTADLNPPTIRAMYDLYDTYYEQTNFETFESDLRRKTDVILLFDRAKGELQGFSTLVTFMLNRSGKQIPCVFSGDTIIHERFWGQRSLGVAFLIYMFKKKLARPTLPLYWFLISKGYKTYLLMANNFKEHFPRYEKATPPEMQAMIREASDRLFPDCYQDNGTLIFPAEKAARLKVGVAEIDSRLLKHPRIEFFSINNPGWRDGEELACLAEMSLNMPFHYYNKSMSKLWTTSPMLKPLQIRFRKAVKEATR
ncbi:MAG: hypothetical protein H7249_17090 [Chitinophagaceae bacterium]|nr:hypothetical protein [Oligoflexus sp.]